MRRPSRSEDRQRAQMAQMVLESYENRRPWAPKIGFGDRLRIVRRHLGIPQTVMAKALGVNEATYSAWETLGTEPRGIVEVAKKVEKLFKVPAQWLLMGDEWSSTCDTKAAGEGVFLEAAL